MDRACAAVLGCALAIAGPAHASEVCPLRLRQFQLEHFLVGGDHGACVWKRLATEGRRCKFEDLDHGRRMFSCGDGLSGVWGIRRGQPAPAAVTVSGGLPSQKLPPHEALRRAWPAPIDTEGWYRAYPIDLTEYRAYYPRRFTAELVKTKVSNPEFDAAEQGYRYVTMNRLSRAAIVGTAKYGCLELYFVTWVPASVMSRASEQLKGLLETLRFVPTARDQHRPWLCEQPH